MRKVFILSTCLFFLVSPNSPADADYLSREFGDMDANGDEIVDWEEYRFYFTYPDLRDFRQADLTKDGKIALFEWVALQQKRYPGKPNFRYLYTDKSGNRYTHENGFWYRLSGDKRYRFAEGQWHWDGRIKKYRAWRYCWDDLRYMHRHPYRHRFSFGYSYGCW